MATSTIATTHAASASSAYICSDHQPKRVILRLRVNEFEGDDHNWEQHVDAVKTYLVWAGRPISEYEGEYKTRKHFAHVEPFQAPELCQTSFHVVLDIEQHLLNEPNFDTLPHEIYRVRRDKAGNLEVRPIQNPDEAKTMLYKTRCFTDRLYPWGGPDEQDGGNAHKESGS